MLGGLLSVGLATLGSCRTDHPPAIMVCIADGFGGLDCDVPGVGKVYKSPTESVNYWATSQEEFAKFAAWCYSTTPAKAYKILEQKRAGFPVNNEVQDLNGDDPGPRANPDSE